MKELFLAATLTAAVTAVYASLASAQAAPDAAARDAEARAASADPSHPEASSAADDPGEGLAVIAVPTTASEPAPPAVGRRSRSGVLEEIIVTAQRREERLQDVPISITVLNQEQLDNANIVNAADIANITPSLSVNTRFGSETATFSIRGFTQDLRTTASVATYFAEVVAPRGQTVQTSGDGAGPGSFFDLQNVQVLKGPQGTLFGRNTTGGAVLLVPRKPTDRFEGYAELTQGNFDALRGQAVVNVPVTDALRLRFGVDASERDGYMLNYTGIGSDDLANVDYTAVRVSGVLDITDTLENYTIFTFVDSKTAGQSSQLYDCDTTTPGLAPYFGPPCEAQLQRQAEQGKNGFYDTASTLATPLSKIQEKRLINTTTWQLSETLTFKNILAYAHLYTLNGSSIFGTDFREPGVDSGPGGAGQPRRDLTPGASIVHPTIPVTDQETYVEELQLQGSSFGSRLVWQTGAYYENSRPKGVSGGRGDNYLYCDMRTIEGDPSEFDCVDPLGGQLGSIIDQSYWVEYLNRAVYGQASFQAFEKVSFTGGLRYTWDKTEGYGTRTRYTFAGAVPLPPVISTLTPVAKSKAPTGLIEMDYKPIEDVMLYGKYVRGYRQGSVNMAADPGVNSWDPEKVHTYEVGAKTSFGGPLPGRFNIAVFYNDLRNMQLQNGYVSPHTGGTTAIFNAGKARIAGTEVEAFLQLTDALHLNLSYAYLDTKLLEQEDRRAQLQAAAGPVAGMTYTPIAVVGDTLPFAADHSVVASLNYQLPIDPSRGELSVGATYVYVGHQRTAASTSSPYSVLDPFSLLNVNASWARMFGSSFDLSAFVTNALEEEYTLYSSGTLNVIGLESRQVGQPRMFGARLRYNFGG